MKVDETISLEEENRFMLEKSQVTKRPTKWKLPPTVKKRKLEPHSRIFTENFDSLWKSKNYRPINISTIPGHYNKLYGNWT